MHTEILIILYHPIVQIVISIISNKKYHSILNILRTNCKLKKNFLQNRICRPNAHMHAYIQIYLYTYIYTIHCLQQMPHNNTALTLLSDLQLMCYARNRSACKYRYIWQMPACPHNTHRMHECCYLPHLLHVAGVVNARTRCHKCGRPKDAAPTVVSSSAHQLHLRNFR